MVAPFNVRPVSVVVHATSGRLAIEWSDGLNVALGSALLRTSCKCAACEQLRRSGKAAPASVDIRLLTVEPFGESALTLSFTDGHDRGVYPWAFLHGLAKAQSTSSTQ